MKEKRIGDFLKEKKLLTKNTISIVLILISILTVVLVSFFIKTKEVNNSVTVGQENLRAMNYEQFVDGDDKVFVAGTQGTDNEEVVDNIKFSTFFLRDLDSDGYAEKLKGTCKEIGKEDTLYMEIIVQTSGYLKNGKIEIDGKNFYLQTALPKDNELKENYIGSNIKNIEFENLNNGTQKMLTGIVCSGIYSQQSKKAEAIGNNINNYSRQDNKIILTGIFVDETNEEHEIRKEINLEMDWYGATRTTINNTYQNYRDLDERINNEDGTIELSFGIRTDETENKLLIYKNYVEIKIPKFNDYNPKSVYLTSSNVEYNYNKETSILTIDRTAKTNETGTITSSVARTNSYEISVKYPIEAYENCGEDFVELLIPIEEYYEGYNNPNAEFDNPYKSNIEKIILRANYNNNPPGPTTDRISIKIGDYISSPYANYVISKNKPMKIYNGTSSEEKDDTYITNWRYYRGNQETKDKIILKETPNGESQVVDQFLDTSAQYSSMENLISNKGIYFNNLNEIMADDGEIKVYDEETDCLLLTIDKTNLNKYTSTNPFIYETPVKHIRIEITAMNKDCSLNVYNIKELDDEYITNNYSLDEFLNLKQIKSNFIAYRGETFIKNVSSNALYEIPTSVATIKLSKSVFSTQVTEKNERIIINAEFDKNRNEVGWRNGAFLVKIPDEIINTEINSITVNNNQVTINSHEYFENEQGKFIKIFTSNNTPQAYTITINCNLTPDPRIATVNRNIELYSINEEGTDYYYKVQDLYDVNGNLNTEEIINKGQVSISLVAPNSLLTNQTASHFDETGTVIISPNIAELKPIYGEDDREKQTVKIGVQMKNNYSSTISEVLILGKIPFEGNTYVLSGNNLNSEFTTNIKPFEIENEVLSGIEIPEELKDDVIVYYSENGNSSKDLNNDRNEWTLAEDVTDWSKIKTYLIDFGNTVIEHGKEYTFYYTIEIPFGVEFNKTAYSHHGIYFSLDTPEGKYRTQTEPNRIGIRIAEKYNLILTKYQKNKQKLISGATYKISKLTEDGEIEESKTAVTSVSGALEMDNLYVEKEYSIEEIQSPKDYDLNSDVIKIKGHINRVTGGLLVEKLEGTIRGNVEIEKNDGEDYKAKLSVEDEVKATLKINKRDYATENGLKGAMYSIAESDSSIDERIVTTSDRGDVVLKDIKIGATYVIEEMKAPKGYYKNPDKTEFKIIHDEGQYILYIKDNNEFVVASNFTRYDITDLSISEDNDIPELSITFTNEKLPTYNLELNKIKKITTIDGEENQEEIEHLSGAKFRLYKNGKIQGTYISDENGIIQINELYQYIEGKDEEATYILKEILPPDGYVKAKDITFKVDGTAKYTNNQEELEFIEILDEGQIAKKYIVDGNTIKLIVENSPIFKLLKKDGETQEKLANVKFAIYSVKDGLEPAKNSKGEICRNKRNN